MALAPSARRRPPAATAVAVAPPQTVPWVVWFLAAALVAVLVPFGARAAGAQEATPAALTGSRYTPVTPVRVLDTRTGLGARAGTVGPTGTIDLQVAGVQGVPSTGVTAVVLNVTVTDPASPGYVTVYPSGQSRPLASNLNFVTNQVAPNQVTVAPGAGGRVTLASPITSTHLVADLVGWYGPGAQSAYNALPPTRVLDTRDGTGGLTTLQGGSPQNLQITGRAGVPGSGVAAVVLNLTVTGPSGPGYLTAYPTGQPQPVASSVNYAVGRTVANLVTVPVGTGGKISLFASNGSAPTVADVAGYYGTNGKLYFPTDITRVLDTRDGTGSPRGRVGAGEQRTVDPAGAMGIGFSGTAAVLANVTATEPDAYGYLTVFPAGTAKPLASNLNFEPMLTVPNATISRLNGGAVTIDNPWGSVHLVMDVFGFFADSGPYTRSAFTNWDNRAKAVAGYTNGQLPPDLLATPVAGCTVYGPSAGDLAAMIAEARAAGTGLSASSCYRDYDGQVAAREYWCGQGACQMAAVPGTSNHGWGKAIDFRDVNGGLTWDSPGYVWLAENAWRFNFIHPNALGPSSSAPEAWHWEWVGDGGKMFG